MRPQDYYNTRNRRQLNILFSRLCNTMLLLLQPIEQLLYHVVLEASNLKTLRLFVILEIEFKSIFPAIAIYKVFPSVYYNIFCYFIVLYIALRNNCLLYVLSNFDEKSFMHVQILHFKFNFWFWLQFQFQIANSISNSTLNNFKLQRSNCKYTLELSGSVIFHLQNEYPFKQEYIKTLYNTLWTFIA